ERLAPLRRRASLVADAAQDETAGGAQRRPYRGDGGGERGLGLELVAQRAHEAREEAIAQARMRQRMLALALERHVAGEAAGAEEPARAVAHRQRGDAEPRAA